MGGDSKAHPARAQAQTSSLRAIALTFTSCGLRIEVCAQMSTMFRAVAAWAPFADLRVLARDLYGMFWVLKYPFVELLVL